MVAAGCNFIVLDIAYTSIPVGFAECWLVGAAIFTIVLQCWVTLDGQTDTFVGVLLVEALQGRQTYREVPLHSDISRMILTWRE